MKYGLSAFCCLVITAMIFAGSHARAQEANTYATLRFDEVIMYDFDPDDKGGSIVMPGGTVAAGVKKKVNLKADEIKALNLKLGDRTSFGTAPAACFDPHLGFIYYSMGRPVAHLTICLACSRLVSSLVLKAQQQGKTGSGPDVYYTGDGISPGFRRFLQGLADRHHFGHAD